MAADTVDIKHCLNDIWTQFTGMIEKLKQSSQVDGDQPDDDDGDFE